MNHGSVEGHQVRPTKSGDIESSSAVVASFTRTASEMRLETSGLVLSGECEAFEEPSDDTFRLRELCYGRDLRGDCAMIDARPL